jgi:hypothetical protein
VNIHPSARKHGLLDEDIRHAATWAIWIVELDDENPGRELRLGFDTAGRLLETGVLVFDSGNQLIIHAMKARHHLHDLLP